MPYPFIKLNPAGTVSVPGELMDLPRDSYTGSYLAEPSDAREATFVADPGYNDPKWPGGGVENASLFSFTGSHVTKWTFDFNMLTIIPHSSNSFIRTTVNGLRILPKDSGIYVVYQLKNGSGTLFYSAFVPVDIYSGNNNVHFRITFNNGINIYVNGKKESKAIDGNDTGYDVYDGYSSTIATDAFMNKSGYKFALGNDYSQNQAGGLYGFRYYPGQAIVPDAPSYDATSGAFIPQGPWNMTAVGSQGLQIESNSTWNGSSWSQNINSIPNLALGFNNLNAGRFSFVYSSPNNTYLWPTHLAGPGVYPEGGLGHYGYTNTFGSPKTFIGLAKTGLGIPGSRQKDSGKIYIEFGRRGSAAADLRTVWDLVGSTDARKVFRVRSRTDISAEGFPTNTSAASGRHGMLLDYDDLSLTIYNQNGSILSTHANIIQPYPMSLKMYTSDGWETVWLQTPPQETWAYVNLGQYPFYIHDHAANGWELCSTAYRKNDYALFDGSKHVHSVVYNGTPSTGWIDFDGLDKDVLFMNTDGSMRKSIIIVKSLGGNKVFDLTSWGGLVTYVSDVIGYNFDSVTLDVLAWGMNGSVNLNGVDAIPETGVQVVHWTGNGSVGDRFFDIKTEYPPTAAMILPHDGGEDPYLVVWSEEDGEHHSYPLIGSAVSRVSNTDFFKVRSGLDAKVSVVTNANPAVPNINVNGRDYTAIVFSEAPGITDVSYGKKSAPYDLTFPTKTLTTHSLTSQPSFGLVKHFSSSPLAGHDYIFWTPETPFFAKRDPGTISEFTMGGVSAWSTSRGPFDLTEGVEPVFSLDSRAYQPVVIRQGLLEDWSDFNGDRTNKSLDTSPAYSFSLSFGKSSLYACRQSSAPLLPITELVANDASFITALVKWSNGDFSDTLIQNMDTSAVTDMTDLLSRAIIRGADGNVLKNFNVNIAGWDTSNVTDMSNMFKGFEKFNQNIGSWNVARVKYFRSMFQNAYDFNGDISGWNTASAIDMGYMFWGTRTFNRDVSNWNTQNVTTFTGMFFNADAFNNGFQPLRQAAGKWNTTSAVSMRNMFNDTANFNQDITNWDVSNVTDMVNMFNGAKKFRQDLYFWCTPNIPSTPSGFGVGATVFPPGYYPAWGGCGVPVAVNNTTFPQKLAGWTLGTVSDGEIAHLNTSAVTTFYYLWLQVRNNGGDETKMVDFNVPINYWDTRNANSCNYMFYKMARFNQPIDNLDFSNATADVNGMFVDCTDFNQNINNWRWHPSVGSLGNMFNNAKKFNQPLNNWNMSNIKDMNSMFKNTNNFNQNISGWDVNQVANVNSMFRNALSFNQNLSGWDLRNSSGFQYYFADNTPSWNKSGRYPRLS